MGYIAFRALSGNQVIQVTVKHIGVVITKNNNVGVGVILYS